MASERELELLDDYLRNKLSAQDKSAFEELLKNEPGLQKELRVQQQVVNSLRNARAAELKRMLNNVPITAAPAETTGSSMIAKVAAWMVVAGLVGGGLYVYFQSEDEPAQNISADSPALSPAAVPSDKPGTSEDNKIQPPVSQSDVTNESEETAKLEAEKGANGQSAKATDSVAPAARNVFEPTEESRPNASESSAASDSNKGVAGVVSTPSIAIEAGINGNNGKYNFHYQFKDNKLYLYGVFEKNLYELMEFFSNNKRTLFLYYKDKYYLLDEDDSKIKRLSPISDPALVKKLKDYRSSR
ncbi:hypothetical protein WBG78_25845 [Chryseolinea sp. T2]|uniref:anti-sigma factor family protein n=1 Tax=Chryseolinea sp. T2 TaxID=3129255 RepID=UPI003076C1FD